MREQVYRYLCTIPHGRVVTYGQIATAVGHPGAARAVGSILHANPDGDAYPCYKVVSCQGALSARYAFGGMEAQAKRLSAEGIEVEDGRVDLNKYGWKGSR